MNEHRHIVVHSDELYHYGVKGMKWKDHVYAVANQAAGAAKSAAGKVSSAASAFTKKFGSAVNSAANSKTAKKIKRKATAAVNRTKTKVKSAVNSAANSKTANKIKRKATAAVNRTKTTVKNVQKNVSSRLNKNTAQETATKKRNTPTMSEAARKRNDNSQFERAQTISGVNRSKQARKSSASSIGGKKLNSQRQTNLRGQAEETNNRYIDAKNKGRVSTSARNAKELSKATNDIYGTTNIREALRRDSTLSNYNRENSSRKKTTRGGNNIGRR